MIRYPTITLLVLSIAGFSCREDYSNFPQGMLRVLKTGCVSKDTGLVMSFVDLAYQDDLGGAGRLEDDLRQMFTVYDRLQLRVEDVTAQSEMIKGHAVVEGRGMKYQGPLLLEVKRGPLGFLFCSGVLTELRGIVHSLRERRIALEGSLPDRLDGLISKDYRGEVGGKEELLKRVRADLAGVQAQAFMAEKVNITVSGDTARVIQSFWLVTRIGDRRIENQGREYLQLRKEGSRWRITGGLG